MDILRRVIQTITDSAESPAEKNRKTFLEIKDFLKKEKIEEKISEEIVEHCKNLKQKAEKKKEITREIIKQINATKTALETIKQKPELQKILSKARNQQEVDKLTEAYMLYCLRKVYFEEIEKLYKEEKEEYSEEKITAKLADKDRKYVMQLILVLKEIKEKEETKQIFEYILTQIISKNERLEEILFELLKMEEEDKKISAEITAVKESVKTQEEQTKAWYEETRRVYSRLIQHYITSMGINAIDIKSVFQQKQKLMKITEKLFVEQTQTLSRIIIREETKLKIVKAVAHICGEAARHIENSLRNIDKVRIYIPTVPESVSINEVINTKQYEDITKMFSQPQAEQIVRKATHMLDNKPQHEYEAFVSRIESTESMSSEVYGRRKLRELAIKLGVLQYENLHENSMKNLIAYFSFMVYPQNYAHFKNARTHHFYEFNEEKYKIKYAEVMLKALTTIGTESHRLLMLENEIRKAAA